MATRVDDGQLNGRQGICVTGTLAPQLTSLLAKAMPDAKGCRFAGEYWLFW